MKKLMCTAAIAAITAAASASTCSTCDEALEDQCLAYDVKLTLKTLAPKAVKCKSESLCGYCGDYSGIDKVYYLDDVTRTFKGYAWTCAYQCGGELELAVWDPKNKVALAIGGVDKLDLSAENCFRYGKKANKVAVSVPVSTDYADLWLAGVKGSFKAAGNADYNFIKSVSGNVAGQICFVAPAGKNVKNTTLCGETVTTETYAAVAVGLCDAFESYCEDGAAYDDVVPATGTWSLKYNKKVSEGKKGTMRDLVPDYAM